MGIKTIDPDYEGYAGVPRQRSAFTGGAWHTVVCIDIGRAKREVSARQVEESIAWPKPRGLEGGRPKGELVPILYEHMLAHGPNTAKRLSDELGMDRARVQNIFQRNTDLFVKLARGKYGARRISGQQFRANEGESSQCSAPTMGRRTTLQALGNVQHGEIHAALTQV